MLPSRSHANRWLAVVWRAALVRARSHPSLPVFRGAAPPTPLPQVQLGVEGRSRHSLSRRPTCCFLQCSRRTSVTVSHLNSLTLTPNGPPSSQFHFPVPTHPSPDPACFIRATPGLYRIHDMTDRRTDASTSGMDVPEREDAVDATHDRSCFF